MTGVYTSFLIISPFSKTFIRQIHIFYTTLNNLRKSLYAEMFPSQAITFYERFCLFPCIKILKKKKNVLLTRESEKVGYDNKSSSCVLKWRKGKELFEKKNS